MKTRQFRGIWVALALFASASAFATQPGNNGNGNGGCGVGQQTNGCGGSTGGTGGAGGAGGQGGTGVGIGLGVGLGVGMGGSATGGNATGGNAASTNTNVNGQSQNANNRQGQQQGQGQHQGQHQTANGGAGGAGGSASQSSTNRNDNASNANNSNANTNQGNNSAQSVTVNGDNVQYNAARIPVATAYAPNIAPTALCMGSTSMGAQFMTVGASVGSSWTDSNCVLLEQVRTVAAVLGDKATAAEMLCGIASYREARAQTGHPCATRAVTSASQELDPIMQAANKPEQTDPIVRYHLGLPPLAK